MKKKDEKIRKTVPNAQHLNKKKSEKHNSSKEQDRKELAGPLMTQTQMK